MSEAQECFSFVDCPHTIISLSLARSLTDSPIKLDALHKNRVVIVAGNGYVDGGVIDDAASR